ncbi:putative PurR-regulated permease PerM [Geomicrobium halophilum]|uniref:Putative PurR-regulated permease PerM n=1 Tax=Geomicrobium halophilum TaxID=549000 RepID=A0A841PL83_9BACL|nr:AI-2E family transporter [Geomicrobium halophilum]MBB6448444.1 putative PurR-regulated permease PerM [Geomicrobium halophilum]
MPQGKYFKFGYAIALLLLIVYLGTLVDFIFTPIVIFLQTVFAPIALAGVLFYLFRPIVKLLKRWMPRSIAILLIYLAFLGLLTLAAFLIGPEIQEQFQSLVNRAPQFYMEMQGWFNTIIQSDLVQNFLEEQDINLEEIGQTVGNYITNSLGNIGSNIAGIVGTLTSAVIVIILVPFVLFYMLKEGEKAPQQILRLLPQKQEDEGKRILSDMDTALASFIQGQIIVSFCVGVLVYIAYLIIGVDYSLILALIAMVTNLIPFIGPWIGTAPGVIVALFDSWVTALLVVGAVVIIQQFESIFIAPQVHGHNLKLHPLTVIFVLLIAGNFGGFLGLLLAVPAYAVGKVIVMHTYRLIRLRYQENED